MKELMRRLRQLETHAKRPYLDDYEKYATKEDYEEVYAIIMKTPADLWDQDQASRQIQEIHERVMRRSLGKEGGNEA